MQGLGLFIKILKLLIPFQDQQFDNCLDNRTHLEDRQIHADYQAADNNPQEGHNHGFQQAG